MNKTMIVAVVLGSVLALSVQLGLRHWNRTLGVSDDTEGITRLMVTGDVLTARTVNATATRRDDFTWPFAETADELRSADILFINLETPLVGNCPLTDTGMIFCGDLRNIEGLRFAGVDVVNLANNHMGNQGRAGVTETIDSLTEAGMLVTGVSGPAFLEQNGVTFAFLGYNEVDQQVGVATAEDELIQQEIATAREQADVVVVQFHWGQEYRHQPTTNQVRLAHLAVDAGADLVVGNHPHWWQPLVYYQGVPIMYSHGNFVFDQMWSEKTREGLVGVYTFTGDRLTDIEFWPVKIEDYGQPRWLEGEEKQEVLERFEGENAVLSNE